MKDVAPEGGAPKGGAPEGGFWSLGVRPILWIAYCLEHFQGSSSGIQSSL